jgi:hypothetical protein
VSEKYLKEITMNDLVKSAPSIASSAMLVELNFSVFTGRKNDRAVSAEIDAQKNTTTRAGNYHKKLFADEPQFDAIQKFAGNTRTYHYHVTMPWSDSGARLLTTPLYFDYNARMTNEQMKFYDLVDVCAKDLNNMIMRAQTKLGAMFNVEDYPNEDEFRAKFRFSLKYLPVPEIGDFRVNVGNEALQYLNESYATYYDEQLKSAYKDVWQRTHEALANMSSKLAGETKQVFRDSLVGNVREMIELLDKFNVTQDPVMKKAKTKIEYLLLGVTPDSLREDDGFRHDVKSKVDDLLKQFQW